MAPWHFFTHLLLVRLLPVSGHFVMAFVYSDPMDTTPEGLPDKLYWRRVGASGTASRSLPRYADMSHSAEAEKSYLCRGSKSPGRRLTCVAASAMEWMRRCGAGHGAQARRRHDVRGASVDDEGGRWQPRP
jgi:hypothetical protein